jgi:hypothetical protein
MHAFLIYLSLARLDLLKKDAMRKLQAEAQALLTSFPNELAWRLAAAVTDPPACHASFGSGKSIRDSRMGYPDLPDIGVRWG